MKKAVEFIALKESGQADQNDHPTRPQPMATPEAKPLGYVEDVVEARTKLGIVFISLPCLMDDSADDPMPIIRYIYDQSAQVHLRQLSRHFIFGERRQ
jgi:hypothetical protein